MKLPPTSITNPPASISQARRAGMTLIEIIVGLAIIAIVSSLGMVGWQSFSRYQAEAEFNNLETAIRAARAKAIHGSTTAEYAGIIFDASSNTNATTVERIINNQKRVFYITEVGAILDHLPPP